MLFGLHDELFTFGVKDVTVKLTHTDTKWSSGMLYAFGNHVRIVEVTADGHRYLSDEEKAGKRGKTQIDALPVTGGSDLDDRDAPPSPPAADFDCSRDDGYDAWLEDHQPSSDNPGLADDSSIPF